MHVGFHPQFFSTIMQCKDENFLNPSLGKFKFLHKKLGEKVLIFIPIQTFSKS